MKIAIGSDHAGYQLKTRMKKHLGESGYEIFDVGCHSEDSVDYPDIAHEVAKAIQEKTADRGVLICGTGIGMCITANRHKGIRATQIHSHQTAELSRKHNDSNLACFGARTETEEKNLEYLKIWLETAFEGGRHQPRLDKIEEI